MFKRTYHMYIEVKPQLFDQFVKEGKTVRASSLISHRSLMPNPDSVLSSGFNNLCNHIKVNKDDFIVVYFSKVS